MTFASIHTKSSTTNEQAIYITMSYLKNLFYLFILLLSVSNSVFAQNQDSLVPTVYYFENGKISSEGSLRNGKPDGYWKSYFSNGKMKTEGNRKNYLLEGVWKFYTEEGMLYLTIDYKENLKDGQRVTYKGIKPYKIERFVADEKSGMTEVFYANGNIKSQTPFVSGREKGLAYEYDTLGLVVSLLTYKAGVLVKNQEINRRDETNLRKGIWMDFHTNREVKNEGLYVKDLKHGYWKYYKADGNLIKIEKWVNGVLVEDADELAKIDIKREIDPQTGKIKSIGGYRNGKKEGVQREYDNNGEVINSSIYNNGIKLAEGIYDEQGRRQGLWKYFFVTGEIKEQGSYKNDKKTGTWKYFFLNGEVEQIGEYVNDLPEGTWRWFYANNQTRLEEEYIDGFEEGPSVEYSETGTIIAEGKYIEGFKEGEWIYFVGNTKETGKYYEGEKQGKWRMIYIDTKKTVYEGEYLNGVENGMFAYYYENGVISKRGRFSLGIKDGLWEFFNEDGSQFLSIKYEKGKEVEYNGVKVSYGKRADRELEEEEQNEEVPE